MIFQVFNTLIGNFWLEADGIRISFEVENKLDYLDNRNRKSSGNSMVDFAVAIKPLADMNLGKISTLLLCSDIQKKDWKLDEVTTGESVIINNFIRKENNMALAVGIKSYDRCNKNNYDYFKNRPSLVSNPNYFVEYGLYYDSEDKPLTIGYSEMEDDAVDLTEFSIAFKKFDSGKEINTDAVDLSVFHIL